jgi:hypothetical protein
MGRRGAGNGRLSHCCSKEGELSQRGAVDRNAAPHSRGVHFAATTG